MFSDKHNDRSRSTAIRHWPPHYPDRPYHHFLQDSCDRYPEKVGLIFEGQRYTYGELDRAANSFANALADLGFGPRQRAAMVVANRPEWIIAANAISMAGGSAVLANPAWKEFELRHAFELTQPTVVLADGALAGLVEKADGSSKVLVCVDEPPPAGWLSFQQLVQRSSPARRNSIEGDLSDVEVALPFSSGTTGLPKAVRHSHRSLVSAVVQLRSAAAMSEDDHFQLFLPLFHIYGAIVVCSAVASAAPLTLFRRFNLDTMLQHIEDHGVTIGFAAAPIAAAMANHPDLERYDLSSIRYLMWGATPVALDVANRVTERSGVRWLHAYGATEVPVLHCNPAREPDRWRLDSPGIPASDVVVRVVDLETHEDLPELAEGEIIVQSPAAMMGYLPEEANEDVLLPGNWYRTGDVGWVEREGWLHITDRAKDILKVNAFSVTPVEIENVLLSHPDVADCAVYGVPDEKAGEVPKAAVVRREGAAPSADELIAWVAERLASYKQVKDIVFVETIPRTLSGKVLRRVLKDADPRGKAPARTRSSASR